MRDKAERSCGMYHIAILPGDGIGTEIVPEAVKVLQVAGAKYNIEFKFTEALIGGAAYDQTGLPLPAETLKLCQQSDAILLGYEPKAWGYYNRFLSAWYR